MATFVCLGFLVFIALPGTPAALAEENPTLAVEDALEDLRGGDWILQQEAMLELARARARAGVQPLRGLLQDTRADAWLRGRALVTLAHIEGDALLDDALGFARVEDVRLRAAAVEALGVIGSRKGRPAIVKGLQDPRAEVRHQAVVAAAAIWKQEAWPTVSPRLKDRDIVMVQHAVRAIAYVSTPLAHRALLELLGHAEPCIRIEAAAVVRTVQFEAAIPALLKGMAGDKESDVRVAFERALLSFPPKVLGPPLVDVLKSDAAGLYEAALRVLKQRPSPHAYGEVAALLRGQTEKHTKVVPDALGLLAQEDPDRHAHVFSLYLPHADKRIREKAVRCLALARKTNLFSALKPLLTDPDGRVRHAAFDALRKADTPPAGGIVTYLGELLRSDDAETVRNAVVLLQEWITPAELAEALARLKPRLGGPDAKLREAVASALERVADEDMQRQIVAAQGSIPDWMVIGAFRNDGKNSGFDRVFPPEEEIDFGKTYYHRHFGHGATFEVRDETCGNRTMPALYLHPPRQGDAGGKTIGSMKVALPDEPDLNLEAFAGINDTGKTKNGVQFEIRADGRRVYRRTVTAPKRWYKVSAPLAAWRGKTITLEISADARGDAYGDHAVLGQPVVRAGEKTAIDILELVPNATRSVEIPGAQFGPYSWTLHRSTDRNGAVGFHWIFPPPVHYSVAYAVTDIVAPAEQDILFHVEADDTFKLWLNGALVAAQPQPTYRNPAKLTARVNKGENRLLVKVANLRDWWWFKIRVTDKDGRRPDWLQVLKE
ncbi:MAG: HEAT repeat domain-containing protein [Kiritimatiellae bacterium]|nr:HEAT repeat domain-containing protein [Kiritimatiellia bacterium]